MNKTIKLVADNPFRVLGIFSNGSLKDLKANASRLNAYMKVGKTVEFPTDLSALMGNVERNADIVTDATSQINLPKDKLKYALFWFAKGNNIDEIAFNNLAGGDMDKAEQLFRKKTTYSSLINRGVLKFILGDSDSAIQLISQVVYDETYRKDFVSAICDDTFSIEEDELSKMFIDSLLTAFDGNKLYSVFKDINSMASEYLIGISSQTHIDYINNEISKANSAGDDSEAQYEAGLQLMENTKEPLKKLKGIFGVKNFRYQQIADSLSKTILQCGIGYYNETDDDDYVSIDKAMKLQKYATDIAVGGITKERCQKNLAILEKKKKDLPPKEVRSYVDVITKQILLLLKVETTKEEKREERTPDPYAPSLSSIWETSPLSESFGVSSFLKSRLYDLQLRTHEKILDRVRNSLGIVIPNLLSIRDELGARNDFYLLVSTRYVSCCSNMIVEAFNKATEEFPNPQKHLFGDYYSQDTIREHNSNVAKLKKFVQQVWNVIAVLSKLDVENDYQAFFNKNFNALKKQANSMGGISFGVSFPYKSEKDSFEACNSVSACDDYLRAYPNGKYRREVFSRKEKLEFDSCKSVDACNAFYKKYPNTQYDIAKKTEDFVFAESHSIADFRSYLSKYPKGKYATQANNCIADEEMWMSCGKGDSESNCQRYLQKFPNGLHKNEAQRVIDEKKQTRTVLIVIAIIVLVIIIAVSGK